MVFNATFNNISAILWWTVFLVEENSVPGENHQGFGLGLWCLTPLFNNISVILWQPVLLVEENRVSGENHRPTVSH
jgi:hypothetical protein